MMKTKMTIDEVRNALFKAYERETEAYNNAVRAVKEAGIIPPVVNVGGGVGSGVTDDYVNYYPAVFFGETKEAYKKAERVTQEWLIKLIKMK